MSIKTLLLLSFTLPMLVSAIPHAPCPPQTPPTLNTQTITVTKTATSTISITAPPSSSITCPPNSTLLHTTECTIGTPISYCYSPEPPIHCSKKSFRGVWHPGHCMTASTCYPLDAPWIVTGCSNGAVPYTTETLFKGVLEGETAETTISVVSCSCPQNQYYSMTQLPGVKTLDTFCMPSSACPRGMSTATATNTFCVTAPASACEGIPRTTISYVCEKAGQTPVYPAVNGGVATGCA